MFVVLYRWRVASGKEQQFEKAVADYLVGGAAPDT